MHTSGRVKSGGEAARPAADDYDIVFARCGFLGHSLDESLLQAALKIALGAEADELIDQLAAFEHHQRWNAANTVLGRRLDIVVGVHFVESDLAVELVRQLLDDGRHHAAGTAPRRPEVHENG